MFDNTIRIPFLIAFNITIEMFIFHFCKPKRTKSVYVFFQFAKNTDLNSTKMKKKILQSKNSTVHEIKIVNFIIMLLNSW